MQQSKLLKPWITKSAQGEFVDCSIGISTGSAYREGANRGSTDHSRGEAHRTVDSPWDACIRGLGRHRAPAAASDCRNVLCAASRPAVGSVDACVACCRRRRRGGGAREARRRRAEGRYARSARALASSRGRRPRSADRGVARLGRSDDARRSGYPDAGDRERGHVSPDCVAVAIRHAAGFDAHAGATRERRSRIEQRRRHQWCIGRRDDTRPSHGSPERHP